MTPPGPRRVAVLVAMPVELRPLVKALGLRRVAGAMPRAYEGRLDDTPIVAALIGIGTRSARRATERVLAAHAVDQVVVMGISGALEPDVEIGRVVVPALVVDAATRREHRPASLGDLTPSGTLLTTDELLLDDQRLAPWRAAGVVALDMETAAVAEVCERAGTPWSVVRAISDRATDGLVDEHTLGMTRPDGTANLSAVARYLATKPWKLPGLVRLGRDTARATRVVAEATVQALQIARSRPSQ